MKTQYINMKVPAELKLTFQKYCKERDLTESFVVRQLITQLLDNKIKLEIN